MNLKQHLIDGDPVAREPELGAFHADAMRQRMLTEAKQQPATTPFWWLSPVAVAAAVAACLLVAIGIGVRIPNEENARPAAVAAPDARRQMQFATPGGTRIIWTFHETLEL